MYMIPAIPGNHAIGKFELRQIRKVAERRIGSPMLTDCRAGKATHVQSLWREAERQLDHAAAAEQAWKECRATLELFRPDGTPNDMGFIDAALSFLDAVPA